MHISPAYAWSRFVAVVVAYSVSAKLLVQDVVYIPAEWSVRLLALRLSRKAIVPVPFILANALVAACLVSVTGLVPSAATIVSAFNVLI